MAKNDPLVKNAMNGRLQSRHDSKYLMDATRFDLLLGAMVPGRRRSDPEFLPYCL